MSYYENSYFQYSQIKYYCTVKNIQLHKALLENKLTINYVFVHQKRICSVASPIVKKLCVCTTYIEKLRVVVVVVRSLPITIAMEKCTNVGIFNCNRQTIGSSSSSHAAIGKILLFANINVCVCVCVSSLAMGPQHHAADDAMNKWEIFIIKRGNIFFCYRFCRFTLSIILFFFR